MNLVGQEKMSLEAAVVHYGVKGMKWGVRKARDAAGLNRRDAGTIQRNNRIIESNKRSLKENKSLLEGVNEVAAYGAIGSAFLNSKTGKKMMEKRIVELQAQNERIRSGNRTLGDKVDQFANVGAFDRLIDTNKNRK